MNKETIALIYNLEEKINSQKEWIEIANIICENEDLPDVKLYLILEILDKLHKRYYLYLCKRYIIYAMTAFFERAKKAVRKKPAGWCSVHKTL